MLVGSSPLAKSTPRNNTCVSHITEYINYRIFKDSLSEFQFCFNFILNFIFTQNQEDTHGSLMIVPAVRYFHVRRIVGIIIVTIIRPIRGIQCLHAQRAQQYLSRILQCRPRVIYIEQFWSLRDCENDFLIVITSYLNNVILIFLNDDLTTVIATRKFGRN